MRARSRPPQALHPTPHPARKVASNRVVAVASDAVPRRVRSLLMERPPIGCGLVVGHGAINHCDGHLRDWDELHAGEPSASP